MTDFDTRLRQGLSEEDRAFLHDLEDGRGLFTQMGDTFRGPMSFWTGFAFLISLVFFGLTLYSGCRLWGAEDVQGERLWLAVFIWSSIAVGMTKIWFWLRMNHLSTLRELKKIELRLARMGEGPRG